MTTRSFAEDTEAARGFPTRRRRIAELRDEILRRRAAEGMPSWPSQRGPTYDLVGTCVAAGWPDEEIIEVFVRARALTPNCIDIARSAGRDEQRRSEPRGMAAVRRLAMGQIG